MEQKMISKEESAKALKESKNALDESVAPLKEAKDAYYAALNEWEKSKNLSSYSPEGLISESQVQYEKEIEAWKNSREVSLELIKLNNSRSNYSRCVYVNHILQEKVDNVGKIDLILNLI
jgi:hypothetical protein